MRGERTYTSDNRPYVRLSNYLVEFEVFAECAREAGLRAEP